MLKTPSTGVELRRLFSLMIPILITQFAQAGLGLIDIARRASEPLRCSLQTFGEGLVFFSLRVVI